jgi:hypothetical protein
MVNGQKIFSLLSIIRNISVRNIKNLQKNVGLWVLFKKSWVKKKKSGIMQAFLPT